MIWGGDSECDHDFSIGTTGGDFRTNKPGKTTTVGANKAMVEWAPVKYGNPYRNDQGPLATEYTHGIADGLGHYIHRGTTKSDVVGEGTITDGFIAEAMCSKCGAWIGNLGNEPSIDLYISNLVSIFVAMWDALADDSSVWINLSDTYWGGGHGGDRLYTTKVCPEIEWKGDYKRKCLCMIPERFAIAMVENGFILRQVIHWVKDNCMPSSASDRCTNAAEYLYHFTKSEKYFYEQQFEPFNWDTMRRSKCRYQGIKNESVNGEYGFDNESSMAWAERLQQGYYPGRNMRNVWHINTRSCDYEYCNDCGRLFVGRERREIKIEKWTDDRGIERRRRICPCGSNSGWVDHFASYPQRLIEVPIRASCPQEICNKCGKPRESIYAKTGKRLQQRWSNEWKQFEAGIREKSNTTAMANGGPQEKLFDGYTDCGCEAGFHPGVVLDLFMGSGTTALEAIRQGKRYVGIDLNGRYCKVGEARAEYAKEEIVMSWMGKRLYAQMAEYGTGLKTNPGEPIFSIADCMILSEALGHYDHAIEYCHIVQEKGNTIKPIKKRMTEITENQLLMF